MMSVRHAGGPVEEVLQLAARADTRERYGQEVVRRRQLLDVASTGSKGCCVRAMLCCRHDNKSQVIDSVQLLNQQDHCKFAQRLEDTASLSCSPAVLVPQPARVLWCRLLLYADPHASRYPLRRLVQHGLLSVKEANEWLSQQKCAATCRRPAL